MGGKCDAVAAPRSSRPRRGRLGCRRRPSTRVCTPPARRERHKQPTTRSHAALTRLAHFVSHPYSRERPLVTLEGVVVNFILTVEIQHSEHFKLRAARSPSPQAYTVPISHHRRRQLQNRHGEQLGAVEHEGDVSRSAPPRPSLLSMAALRISLRTCFHFGAFLLGVVTLFENNWTFCVIVKTIGEQLLAR